MSAIIIVVVSIILVVVLLIALILLLHGRRGKKGTSAVGDSTKDLQQQAQQGDTGAWNQQEDQVSGGWGQPAQQQPGGWGTQPQQQSGGWGAQAPVPTAASADAGTQICPSCGASNPAGEAFCSNCGNSLLGAPANQSTPIQAQQQPAWEMPNAASENAWGTPAAQPQQPAVNPSGNQGTSSPLESEPEAQDPWRERSADSMGTFTVLAPLWKLDPSRISIAPLPAPQEQSSYSGNDITGAVPALPGPKDRGLTARDLAHEYLQFTAFYSRVVPTMTWNTLLVYAHIEAALQAVREDALKFKEEIGSLASEASAWAALPTTRGTQITVVPTCPGVRFNPERFVFTWIEDWHQIKFRFQVDQRLANAIGNGEITMYAGPLIIGSVKLSMRFVQQSLAPHIEERKNFAEASAYLYKRIFTSYSHQDTPVVLACRNAYKALGFESLIDIDTLRSGQRWNTELMKMIDTADLFQLFWSAGAAQSAYVRQEWLYALQRLPGESFIRPVYWEKPLVSPPVELKHLHFAYIELPRLETPEETQKLPPRGILPGRVRVERGKEPGRIYEIRKDALSIGRSRESDLFLEDPRVSRSHASVLKTNGGIYVLRDEGSANGTKLNGQLVNKFQMLPLAEGDRIQIGETVLVFLKGNVS